MSQGWENYEVSPIEFFHGELLELFHEFRKNKVGDSIVVELDGEDFNNIVYKIKNKVYEKYSNLNLDKPIEKDKIATTDNSDYALALNKIFDELDDDYGQETAQAYRSCLIDKIQRLNALHFA